MSIVVIAPLAAALLFGLISGFNDGGNLLGSFTAGRVISSRLALLVLLVVPVGPLVAGSAVAQTVGEVLVPRHESRTSQPGAHSPERNPEHSSRIQVMRP